jgi:hypothetical protein
MLYQNREEEISDARRRRILRELHQAAAVQDPTVHAYDLEGRDVTIYDQQIVQACFYCDVG